MATNDHRIAVLRSVPGLAHYPDKALARLAPLFDECAFAPGDVLMVEDVIGREAFLLVEGEATVTRKGRRIGHIGAGQFVGEVSLLDHLPRSATVRATTPVRALVVGPASFASVMDAPALLRRLVASVADHVGASDASDPSGTTSHPREEQ